MTEPTCLVCLIPYDAEDHRPLLLPACGHTFCAVCLGCLYGRGNRSCPKCRKDGAVQPVSSLPVNYSLLEIAEGSACEASDVAEPNSASPRAAGASKPKEPTPNSNSFCLNTTANPFGIASVSRPQVQASSSGFPHLSPLQPLPLILAGGSSQLAPQEASNFSSPPRPTGSPSPIESFLARLNNHPSSAPSSPTVHQNQVRKDQLLQKFLGSHLLSQATSQQLARAAFQKSLTNALSRNNTASPPPARTQVNQNSASAVVTALEKEEQDELDFQMALHLTFCKDSSHDQDLHNRCSSWRLQNP